MSGNHKLQFRIICLEVENFKYYRGTFTTLLICCDFLAWITFSLLSPAHAIPSKQRRRRKRRMKVLKFPSFFNTRVLQPYKSSFKLTFTQCQHCLALALLSISIAQHQHCLELALLRIIIAQHYHCLALLNTRLPTLWLFQVLTHNCLRPALLMPECLESRCIGSLLN